MKEEKLKSAFSKIKEDMLNLGKEISDIKNDLLETNSLMKQINEEIIAIKLENMTKFPSTHTSTDNSKTSTHPVTSTHNTTHPQEIQGLKYPNSDISIGNQGASTDRQTDRQTDQQTHFTKEIDKIDETKQNINQLDTTIHQKQPENQENVVTNAIENKPIKEQISEASEILDSLDAIKKEIRRKFKRITQQEMLVFSTIYQLEEQDSLKEGIDYKKIALKLGLSQSSIRDYIQRMIEKGIPIDKEKLNNKKIILRISPELKKIAQLDTIIKLREL